MAQGCMGAEHQNRRSKRANVLTRQYSHDDKDIELAAKEEDELQQAIERSKRKDRERVLKEKRASPSDSKSGSESHGLQKEKRPDKGENCIDFDPVKNGWHKTLVKARRIISKLATEQHILETFSCIDQSRSKVVKQQQELTRCKEAVQRCWDGVRDCILQCEKVEGHRQIPQDHYDEHEELAAEHIVCCSCGNEEADDDNDILLCDGHGCSRAYHVQCLPFKDDFILQELLDSDDGWLCPACDCRYDILWALAQTLDLEFEQLTEQSAEQVVATHNQVLASAKGGGLNTILEMDWPSEDDDDGDFEGSSDESDGHVATDKARRQNGSAEEDGEPSKKSRRVVGASTSKGYGEEGDSAGCSNDASDDEDGEEDSDEEDDDDNYESDDLDEGEGKLDAEGLRRLEEDQKALLKSEEECDVIVGKRKRQKVDYAALNAAMFGDFESYEGEGSDDNYET